jgi:hypothetical protein
VPAPAAPGNNNGILRRSAPSTGTHHNFSFRVYDDRPHMSTYASNGYLVPLWMTDGVPQLRKGLDPTIIAPPTAKKTIR